MPHRSLLLKCTVGGSNLRMTRLKKRSVATMQLHYETSRRFDNLRHILRTSKQKLRRIATETAQLTDSEVRWKWWLSSLSFLPFSLPSYRPFYLPSYRSYRPSSSEQEQQRKL